MESRTDLHIHEIKYVCDHCEKSCVEYSDKRLIGRILVYRHICPNCKHGIFLREIYPYLIQQIESGYEGENLLGVGEDGERKS